MSAWSRLARLTVIGPFSTLSCGQPPPAPEPPAAAPVEPAPAPAVPEPTPPEPPQPPAIATASEPTSVPDEPAADASPAVDQVAEQCAALCQQASEKCSSRAARKCRANCERYAGLAERCGQEVLEALRCQASVPGLICSNVVGECKQQFQAMDACEAGKRHEVTEASSTPAAPPGWATLQDSQAGFSVAFPKLVPQQIENGNRTWRVTVESGVTYVVAVLPPFATELTDKALVRKVLVILGQSCQRDMKIHGRFETEGKVAVRFDSNCTDGKSWHGMLRISDRHVIMTAEIVPPGQQPTGNAFYYSFSYSS